MTYKYRKLAPGQHLYDDCNLNDGGLIDAQYEESVVDSYHGNPMAECIGGPYSREELIQLNTHIIRMPSQKLLQSRSLETNLMSVDNIFDLMVAMPWHYTLDVAFRSVLQRTYGMRKLRVNSTTGVPIIVNAKKIESFVSGQARTSEAVPGLSLIGISGCGKSRALNETLSRIPQVVVHNRGQFNQFIQINYITVVVNKQRDSKFLWDGIAKAIDDALQNPAGEYQAAMSRKKTLSEKMNYAAKLCNTFNVGVLILDEIEFLLQTDFHKSALENLVTFNNVTNTALMTVGSQEAKEQLFTTFQMTRRFGKDIEASEYCRDIDAFQKIFRQFFMFQWFSNPDGSPVEPTDAMLEAMFFETKGTVGLLAEIYAEMNRIWLIEKEDGHAPSVDEKLIERAALSYAKKQHNMIEGEANPFGLSSGDETISAYIASLGTKSKETEEYANVDPKELIDHEELVDNVTTAIRQSTQDYREDTIRSIADKALLSEKNITVPQAVAKVMAILLKEKNDKRRRQYPQKAKYDIETAKRQLIENQKNNTFSLKELSENEKNKV